MCLRLPIREPLSTYYRTENTNEHVDQYQLARGQEEVRQKEVVHQVETLEWAVNSLDNIDNGPFTKSDDKIGYPVHSQSKKAAMCLTANGIVSETVMSTI
ncbi:hypothetical protein GJ496_002841 [Pomphorhynchus laevis]|nr:hypothetical protein GJ496_002841 [Pomphorhynchus laevis]